jgi:hypothetical protein
MPPRHISPQSFDDILSELGDDPAIADPHGIRKSSARPKPPIAEQAKPKSPSFAAPQLSLGGLKTAPILIVVTLLVLAIGAVFFLLESNKAGYAQELNTLQAQISSLKNELTLAQGDWLSEQESLYSSIEEMEVSIHSLKIKAPASAPQSRPAPIPYEAELQRWRYLGLTRMGVVEQAIFHTGKATLMVAKEGLALGEWRLAQVKKEVAILTHPKGKSITLKSTKLE